MLRRFLERIHNFRLLPLFVIISMVIGIVIGPLIEVPVMLALVWFAKITQSRLFHEELT